MLAELHTPPSYESLISENAPASAEDMDAVRLMCRLNGCHEPTRDLTAKEARDFRSALARRGLNRVRH